MKRNPEPGRLGTLKGRALFFLLLVISISASCGVEEAGEAKDSSFCDDRADTPVLAGFWNLSGKGSRSSCSAPELNTDFDLFSVEIPVDQTGPEISAVLGRGAFELYNGSVEGNCVNFSIYEQAGGLIIHMNFIGAYSRGKIEGHFSGRYSGEEKCNLKDGSFRVDIR